MPGVKPVDRWPIWRRFVEYFNTTAKAEAQVIRDSRPGAIFTGPVDAPRLSTDQQLVYLPHFYNLGQALRDWHLHKVRSRSGRKGGRPRKTLKRKVKKKSC